MNPQLIGFVPSAGKAMDVVIDKVTGLIYVASADFGLSVIDVVNPNYPVAIGATVPSFYGEHVATSESIAVVTGNNLGIKIINISNKTKPQIVGLLNGTMKSVAMAGQFAYVLEVVPGNPSHTDLIIVNLIVPSTPTITGRVTLGSGMGTDVKVVGSLAYVSVGSSGFQIVDISNSTDPKIIGSVDTPGTAYAVEVANGYAYIADSTSVQIVNVINPINPFIVTSIVMPSTNVAVAGSQLYVIGGSLLKIINISNPSVPQILSTSNSYDAQGIDANSSFVFLASPAVDAALNKGGLYIVDVSNPYNPTLLTNLYGGFDNIGIAATNSIAVVTGNNLGIKIINISNKTKPQIVGLLNGTMKSVAMAGQFAYVLEVVPGNPSHTDLIIVNLIVPSTPTITGRVTLGSGMGTDVKVVGSLAYVSVGSSGFQIVDISNSTDPKIIGSVDTPGTAYAVEVANGYAYIADSTSVQIVNVINPINPFIVTSIVMPSTNVAVAGSQLYVIGGSLLKIINISNPSVPQILSTSNSYDAQGIDANSSFVFLATPALAHSDPLGGVHILDVSDSYNVKNLKDIVVPGTTRTILSIDDYVYAGDSASIIDIIELVCPEIIVNFEITVNQ